MSGLKSDIEKLSDILERQAERRLNDKIEDYPTIKNSRKLKAVWTPEMAQDLNVYHGVTTKMLVKYLQIEIDSESV